MDCIRQIPHTLHAPCNFRIAHRHTHESTSIAALVASMHIVDCFRLWLVRRYESLITNEYLEDAYAQPAMMPRAPLERAHARLVINRSVQALLALKCATNHVSLCVLVGCMRGTQLESIYSLTAASRISQSRNVAASRNLTSRKRTTWHFNFTVSCRSYHRTTVSV